MDFAEMLGMRQVSEDVFEAVPPGSGFLFGGLSLALALVAASKTVEASMVPKSLHIYFLRPGEWGAPTALSVKRWPDGRSFATRNVTISQQDRVVAALVASFHVPGNEGEGWQANAAPTVPPPGSLSPTRVSLPEEVIDVRRVGEGVSDSMQESWHPYWARARGSLGDVGVANYAALGFMSDYLVILSMHDARSVVPPTATIRTLSQSVWFHRPVLADHWHLFVADPLSVTFERGTVLGSMYSEDALLVGSFTQEVIIR